MLPLEKLLLFNAAKLYVGEAWLQGILEDDERDLIIGAIHATALPVSMSIIERADKDRAGLDLEKAQIRAALLREFHLAPIH